MSCGVILVGELLTFEMCKYENNQMVSNFYSSLSSLLCPPVRKSDYGLYILLVIIGTGADAPGSYEV